MAKREPEVDYPGKIHFREFVRSKGRSWPLYTSDADYKALKAEWDALPTEHGRAPKTPNAANNGAKKKMTTTKKATTKKATTSTGNGSSKKAATTKKATAAAAGTKKGASKAKSGVSATDQVLSIVNKRTKSNPIARTELATLEQKMAVLRLANTNRIGKVTREGRTFYYGLPQKGAGKGTAKGAGKAQSRQAQANA